MQITKTTFGSILNLNLLHIDLFRINSKGSLFYTHNFKEANIGTLSIYCLVLMDSLPWFYCSSLILHHFTILLIVHTREPFHLSGHVTRPVNQQE